MRRTAAAALTAIILCTLTGSCARRGRIIPPKDLTDIYADMFLADQWVSSHHFAKRAADTTYFYEPIFREYGYGTRDYQASVKYYVSQPERYSKILRDASRKLDKEMKRLKEVDRILAKRYRPLAYSPTDFPDNMDSLIWRPDTSRLSDSIAIDSVSIDTVALDSLSGEIIRIDTLSFIKELE